MRAKNVENFDTDPDLTEKSADPESRIKGLLLRKMKQKRISFKEAGEKLSPPLQHNSLSAILTKDGTLSVDRLHQLCKILEIDPVELMMESLGHRPEHAYLLTSGQELVICKSTLHYKIAYTIYNAFRVMTRQEIEDRFFDQRIKVQKAVTDLLRVDAIVTKLPGMIESPFYQIPRMHFSPEYDELLSKLSQEYHSGAVSIMQNHEHLSKYVLTKYHLAYLTPEQMIQVRVELLRLQQMIWNFQQQNMAYPELKKLADPNFMALMTFFAPVNPASFVRNRIS